MPYSPGANPTLRHGAAGNGDSLSCAPPGAARFSLLGAQPCCRRPHRAPPGAGVPAPGSDHPGVSLSTRASSRHSRVPGLAERTPDFVPQSHQAGQEGFATLSCHQRALQACSLVSFVPRGACQKKARLSLLGEQRDHARAAAEDQFWPLGKSETPPGGLCPSVPPM